MTKIKVTRAWVMSGLWCLLACMAGHAVLPLEAAQIAFEQAMRDLASPDAGVRLRTVQMLKDAAYPETAVPLAKLVLDPQDAVQLEAIAAELNIFLTEKIVSRKRVGLVIEKRTPVVADAAFTAGPRLLGPQAVPVEVLNALQTGARDDNPRVRLEAIYAFGVLAVEPGGGKRRDLLRTSGPELAATIGAADPALRYAGLRVIGRVFEWRPQDDAIDSAVGDAVITALNEKDDAVRGVAMQALGAMRYGRAVQGLTSLFQYYGRGGMAEAALDAIARIAHPSSVPVFVSQLASKSPTLKAIAIDGLARAGDRTKLADVQTALTGEPNDSVLLAGRYASATLSGAAVASIDPIVEALTKPKLREQARGYFIALAFGRTQTFVRYLQDPDARVRADLVDVLGLSYDTAAIALVEPMASDRDAQVAQAVERALARLRQAGRVVA